MATALISPPGAARLAATIGGLANLAAFLETHPGLPLADEQSGDPFTVYAFAGTDEENRAEVDRVAAVLGTEPGWMPGSRTHYTAARRFGGGVTYRVLAVDSTYHKATAAGSGAAA